MRYSTSEVSSAHAKGWFNTGDTVAIEVFKVGTGLEALTSAVCTEVGTSGVFQWAWSNLITSPTAFTEYIWVMTNTDPVPTVQVESATFGGVYDIIGGTGPSAVTIQTQEADTAPIPDVYVQVYNLSGLLLRTGTTDAAGELALNMNDGTYQVTLTKNQVNFAATEALIVSGATTDTYTGEVLTLPVPATANVCRVSGFAFVQNSTGAVPSFDGTATIKNLPFNIDNIFYEGQTVLATFNATTGQFYWDLPYNAVAKLNSRVVGFANGVISVPPQAAASLNDLDIR